MRLFLAVVMLALVLGGSVFAQNRVRTETIRPPAAANNPPASEPAVPVAPGGKFKADAHVVGPAQPATPAILTDLARLPGPVARTRERIVAAARSGDLQMLLGVMQANLTLPVFSFSKDKDPIAFWKANYPDSEGVEV